MTPDWWAGFFVGAIVVILLVFAAAAITVWLLFRFVWMPNAVADPWDRTGVGGIDDDA